VTQTKEIGEDSHFVISALDTWETLLGLIIPILCFVFADSSLEMACYIENDVRTLVELPVLLRHSSYPIRRDTESV